MRRSVVSCLALAYVLGLPGPSPADDDDARALVVKAVKALGGEELIARRAALHARFQGTLGGAAGGEKITGEMWLQTGAQRMDLLLGLGGERFTLRQAWHGGKGWRELNGTPQEMGADEAEQVKQSEYVQRVMDVASLLKDKDLTLRALGKSKVDGAELLG